VDNKEKSGSKGSKIIRTAAQTAVFMAILTLVSKLLGFVREMVMAGFFGTSYITDAYVMALAIPGMIFAGFFAAINTAYMPLFSKITENDGSSEGNRFTSEVINLGLLIALISTLLGIIFSDQIVHIFASGFTNEKAELTSRFLRVTFSFALFTSVSGLLEAHLRYKGVFLAPILIGYLQNIVVISVIVISAYYNHYLLVWGWLISYIIRMLILWKLAGKQEFRYTNKIRLSESAKKIMALSIPVFIGSYISQINVFVDKTLASKLQVGSIAALNYGHLLIGIITGMTISIIMIVIYPKMTQAYSLRKDDYFNEIVSSGFNLILIITMPCSIGAMLYSEEIVQIVYERGAFNEVSTALTGPAFFFYSMGILFISLNNLLSQTFYSMHDMKTPMLFGAIGITVNIILNIILVRSMAHGGIALATSIAAMSNTVLLYGALRKKHPYIRLIRSKLKIIKIFISTSISIFFSWLIFIWIRDSIWMPRMVLLFLTVTAAFIFYLALLKIFKIEELKFIKSIFKRN
jgi:putative peptidoglycan lipid II flippase